MNPIDSLLSRLEGVRKSGKGYLARCPSHSDKSASLSISEGADNRVLVNCFSGCKASEVVEAVGLHLRDLFPDKGFTPSRKKYSKRAIEKRLVTELSVLNIAINMRHDGEYIHQDDAVHEELSEKRIRKMFKEVYE